MEYWVVEEYDTEEFSKAVQQLLDDGWELYGAPMLTAYYSEEGKNAAERHHTIYAQALTKKKPSIGSLAMGKARIGE